MSEAVIEFERVEKHYGGFHALRSIDLTIAAGEKVVICGPSGSGKSTLLRCINQLETHSSGRIRVLGIELGPEREALVRVRRAVGMVFQQFNLFPHLTVLENCVLAQVHVLGKSRQAAEATATTLLERVRIADQAVKYPGELSGGQQQRVAIARALCLRPAIMLFDEPTSALDPEMVKEILDLILELSGEGMTMVCVTHEMRFAQAIADRVVFMDAGAIVENGSPAHVLAAPRAPRLQRFLAELPR